MRLKDLRGGVVILALTGALLLPGASVDASLPLEVELVGDVIHIKHEAETDVLVGDLLVKTVDGYSDDQGVGRTEPIHIYQATTNPALLELKPGDSIGGVFMCGGGSPQAPAPCTANAESVYEVGQGHVREGFLVPSELKREERTEQWGAFRGSLLDRDYLGLLGFAILLYLIPFFLERFGRERWSPGFSKTLQVTRRILIVIIGLLFLSYIWTAFGSAKFFRSTWA